MYPARRGVGKRTQYFAWDQTKTLRSVWNGKNFVGRKTWTTGKTQIQEPLFLHSTRHQTLSKSDAVHLSNSKQIVNEKDSFESTPNHDSTVPSSVSSNNSHNNMNNNTDTSRTRKVPKAVAKARANGEPVVFVEGKWVCMDCGYIYPDDASVPFEDLPDNWRCPLCGSPKRRFFKKQGNKVVARMSDDRWMIVVAVGFSFALIWFGYWAIHNL